MSLKKENIRQMCRILLQDNDWKTAYELSARLHTTTRTIRNYIKEVNNTGGSAPRILSSEKGYKWNRELLGNDDAFSIATQPLPDDPDERYWYMIRRIIVDQVSIDELMEALYISDNTIDSDLRQVRKIVKEYDLKLRRRGDRLSFSGKEADIRLLSFQCIRKTSGRQTPSLDFIVRNFPEYDCLKIREMIAEVMTSYDLKTTAYDQYELLLFVVLQLRQVSLDNIIRSPECPVAGLHNYYEFSAANSLADKLETLFDGKYNLWEREYLTVILISKTQHSFHEKCMLIPNYTELHNTTMEFMKLTGISLNTEFNDPDFMDEVTHYFQRFLVRNTMRMTSHDPTYEAIRMRYPVILDVCAWFLLYFSKYYHVETNRSEVGFLAKILIAHMRSTGYLFEQPVESVLVCPAFNTFPWELKDALEDRLSDTIRIHKVIDTLDTDRIKETGDLYLSVLPLKGVKCYVNIPLYPGSADFRHIYTRIHQMKMRQYGRRLGELLKSYNSPDMIEYIRGDASARHKLPDICSALKNSGYITEEFLPEIIERENLDRSIYNGNLAILHNSSISVLRDFIYIIVSEAGVRERDYRLNLICIIGTRQPELVLMQEIFDLFLKVFTVHENLAAVLHSNDYEMFIETVDSFQRW